MITPFYVQRPHSTLAASATSIFSSSTKSAALHHVTLKPGQWLEITGDDVDLNVLSGSLWLVYKTQDIFLSSGQKKRLSLSGETLMASTLGQGAVSVTIESFQAPRLI